MKWSWLRAAILGVLIGPAPATSEPIEAEARRDGPTAEQALLGRAIRGPDFHVWDEYSREAADWALDELRARGESQEVALLHSLSVRAAARPPLLTPYFEIALQDWILEPGEPAQDLSLGLLLCLIPALDRTWLIASWATAPDERVRIALARALSAPFDAVGVGGALEVLRNDPSRKVRELARVADATRRLAG